jgi:hypothetical protein
VLTMPDPQGDYVRQGNHISHTLTLPIRKTATRLHVLVCIQILLSVTVLSLCLGVIATLPNGASSPSPVSFAVFVTVFSVVTWIYIFPIAGQLKFKFGHWPSIAAGGLSLIFYLSSALLFTVAIAPAQSCSNDDYVQENKLLAGVGGSRCRLIQATIAILWVGITPYIKVSDISIRRLLCMRSHEVVGGLEKR